MENVLKPPKSLSFDGNVAENWRRWLQQLKLYFNATGIDKKSERIQCSTLLTIAGEDAVEIYNTFAIEEGERDKLDVLISKFQDYCTPRRNVTYERHIFNTRNQGTTETIDLYVTELRKLAKKCEFGELNDSLIKDRIVCGILNDGVRARLLREADLTLTKAIQICKTAELSAIHLKDMSEKTDKHVDAVRAERKPRQWKGQNREKSKSTEQNTSQIKCNRCGYNHQPRNCPAYGQACKKCGKQNHFARVCKSTEQTQPKQNKVNAIDAEDTDGSEYGFFVGTIQQENETDIDKRNWNIQTSISGKKVLFKIDSGAQCNVLPLNVYKKLSNEKLEKTKARLTSYTGHQMNTVGKTTLLVSYRDKYYPTEF